MKKIFFFLMLSLMVSPNIKAQDWPNLKRYQSENEQITPKQKGEKRVVFFGNSITEQWRKIVPEFFATQPYLCRGIGGQTTAQMLVRFRQDVVDLNPTAVVILAGTNDIAENGGPTTLKAIMDNLKSMAEIARSNKIKVVLCSVLPAEKYPWRPKIEPVEKIIALNKMIEAYCQKEPGIVFLNYFPAMATEKNAMLPEYTTDGVHLNKSGYMILEKEAQKLLKKILK